MNVIKMQRLTNENYMRLIDGILHLFSNDDSFLTHPNKSAFERYSKNENLLKKYLEKLYITVALINEKVEGYSEWGIRNYDKTMHLGLIYVDNNLRSKGIGSLLLADGESYAINNGMESITSMADNSNALNFFLKHGYCKISHDMDIIKKSKTTRKNKQRLKESGQKPFTTYF